MPMLTSVLFDKTEWETPDSFNPGHFLNAEGKFVKREALLAFSAGNPSSPWSWTQKPEPEYKLDPELLHLRVYVFVDSSGKRVCLGEGLAKMELFLFLVGLLQKFSFSVPDGVELSTEGITGTTRVPHPFKVYAKARGWIMQHLPEIFYIQLMCNCTTLAEKKLVYHWRLVYFIWMDFNSVRWS